MGRHRRRDAPPAPGPAAALAACLALGAVVVPVRAQEAAASPAPTAAREWVGALLFAIRRDLARPTVHARNLYHLSAAMYDAWAVYDERAGFAFLIREASGPADAIDAACRLSPEERAAIRTAAGDDPAGARRTALGHAAWRLLEHRFGTARRAPQLLDRFERVAVELGLDRADAATDDPVAPAVLGARVADCVIDAGTRDNANESADYANLDYAPVNPPLDPTLPGNPGLADPDRWQPLALETFIDQSGNLTGVPSFLGADWGGLVPFALGADDRTERVIDGVAVPVWLDPGPPPVLGDDPDANAVYRAGHARVVQWSSMLDPDDGVTVDISPGAIGNLGPLEDLPTDPAAVLGAYDGRNGGFGGAFAPAGHAVNPATGEPYAPNVVARGDYTRVLAEFWADGPDSETPPGHWFSVYDEAVVGHPAHTARLEGAGEPIDALEYDLNAYLALGGAMHDSAIAAWSVKRAYDSVRPVSAIRYMAALGQSTDAGAGNYHVHGLPLVPGMIETVLPGDPLAGASGEHVGRIKGRAWRGPDAVSDPSTDVAGVGWILLETWWPYQRPSFVTPPFAGYVSGHSTFSRAAAEVLTRLTGDAFFPGGLGEFTAPANDFLVFERGPSADVVLQWATYRDAADQTALSRIWGGIHPPADDLAGRRMGEIVGARAWARTRALFDGRASAGPADGPGGSAGDRPAVSDAPAGESSDRGSGGGCSIATPGRDTGLTWLCALTAVGPALRRRVPTRGVLARRVFVRRFLARRILPRPERAR